MNMLYFSLSLVRNLDQRGIYPDLLRQFVKHERYVRAVSCSPSGCKGGWRWIF